MPIDLKKAVMAAGDGLSVVCSTCEKYWAGIDRGLGRCLAVDGCGSPMAGDVFHEYRGPMANFAAFCFVCGGKATHVVRVDNNVRAIGVCSDHVRTVKTLKPEGKRAPSVVLISKDGERLVSEDDPPEKMVLRFRS